MYNTLIGGRTMTAEERDYLFDVGVSLGNVLYRQCELLLEMIDEMDRRDEFVIKIASLENEGDLIFHEFGFKFSEIEITPSDRRANIYRMESHLEESIDMINELAKCLVRYNVTEATEGYKASVNCIYGAVNSFMHLINAFRLYQSGAKGNFIKTVNAFDSYGVNFEKMYELFIRQLFTEETDPIDVIRWKAIYDTVREVFEAFETCADDCYNFIYFNS